MSVAIGVAAAPPSSAAQPTRFKNCTALTKVYKHGVGQKGAKDRVRGKSKPVRTFTVNNAAYAANRHLDADRDGVACERR